MEACCGISTLAELRETEGEVREELWDPQVPRVREEEQLRTVAASVSPTQQHPCTLHISPCISTWASSTNHRWKMLRTPLRLRRAYTDLFLVTIPSVTQRNICSDNILLGTVSQAGRV